MGFFPALRRLDPAAGRRAPGPRDGAEPPLPVPPLAEAVADALAQGGGDVLAACAVMGHQTAADGIDLGEALHSLRLAFEAVTEAEPSFAATEALARAWSEETLAYLHGVSCEDPLTGLSTPAHLRGRLSEIHRAAEQAGQRVSRTHALVVVELPPIRHTDPFGNALLLVRCGEHLQEALSGDRTVSRVGARRLVGLAGRTPRLAGDVAGVRDLVCGLLTGRAGPRVWIEPLPDDLALSARLLDELAR